ncbi:glutaredoxin-like protein NrdH [Brachybacterium sp. ACRRE]|uniref:glutaredoxin-like protein NrdH n=1 Tax=Brachybacterium sp. ACRRE TaxID=2918184 RepID=UPI001EF2E753|nr:glutaredoxin-like protein NrdH [Brachybacterium sp. ACRRE]MCG7308309.1 glutaredoxin-like protein NrdH [Brachybacterium sp. ACRRE]
MTITVYSKPMCVQCDATKRALAKSGVDFEVVDMAEDAAALAHVKELGYVQAPVVEAGEDRWSGFRPDKIKAIAHALAPGEPAIA